MSKHKNEDRFIMPEREELQIIHEPTDTDKPRRSKIILRQICGDAVLDNRRILLGTR